MLSPLSKTEFDTARNRAFIEEWLSTFTGKSNDLLSFGEIKEKLHLHDSTYKGLQEIELDKIIGSVGRYRDFTRTFLPKNNTTEERWRRVDAVAHEQGYPPIEVYKVGEVYFVADGNHRVSVARIHNSPTIEAIVIEYNTPVSISKDDDIDAILLKAERAEFLMNTQLDQIRPGNNVILTEPGRYRRVIQHILGHKYLKELEYSREISMTEAVGGWYDTVYLPIIRLIREQNVLKDFPGRTESDLYAWMLSHRGALEEQMEAHGFIPDEDILDAVATEEAPNPLTRLISYIHHQANLTKIPLKVQRAKFLADTGLDKTRPEHEINFSELYGYELAKEHIIVHKYLQESEHGRLFSMAEAAASWYDTVYLPMVHLVRERKIQSCFPGNTESDLYIWLVMHRATLEEQTQKMGHIPDEQLIEDLEEEARAGAWMRWLPFFQRRLRP